VGAPAGQCYRRTKGGFVLNVRLTPKSSKDEITGFETYDGNCVLKARVKAIPDRGQANAALERLISKWLGVPGSTVTLASGGKSRLKSLAVSGDTDELICLLKKHLANLAR
jgi:uncharacterized protein (TIGR00251 family)